MDMFHGLSFDESQSYGKPLLECTAEFYAAEAIQVFEQSDLPQYLKHVDVITQISSPCSFRICCCITHPD